MSIQIEFLDNVKETTLPIIKLTKSINGKTGTATFIFIKPTIFKHFFLQKDIIKKLTLVCETKKISTTDLTLFFEKGEPYLIKAIFIFKNSSEWFDFLNFMNFYSKETGLLFE
jgi:photosystem II protein